VLAQQKTAAPWLDGTAVNHFAPLTELVVSINSQKDSWEEITSSRSILFSRGSSSSSSSTLPSWGKKRTKQGPSKKPQQQASQVWS
jgi:hypothetical protein